MFNRGLEPVLGARCEAEHNVGLVKPIQIMQLYNYYVTQNVRTTVHMPNSDGWLQVRLAAQNRYSVLFRPGYAQVVVFLSFPDHEHEIKVVQQVVLACANGVCLLL